MYQSNNHSTYAALYTRFSRDEPDGESNSIANQKKLLLNYAHSRGIVNTKFFVDDGFTGTNFNRPDFKAMIAECESKKISTIIVKDMSRLGRNYLMVGYYTEIYFPENNIHFIAINDDVDSVKGDNEFTPFRNIMNEWYVKDTSKKVKSVIHNKGMSGERICNNVIYGYKHNPDNPKEWIIDEEAAQNVRTIFQLFLNGKGTSQIAKYLHSEKILVPSVYAREHGKISARATPADPCLWDSKTIREMLKRQEYVGDTVNFKTKKVSYKSKKKIYLDKSEYVIFPDTQEPIIDRDTYERVQKIMESRKKVPIVREPDPLGGYIFCADCGSRMYITRSTVFPKKNCYHCGRYKRSSELCSSHYIRECVINQLILNELQKVFSVVKNDRERFLNVAIQSYANRTSYDVKKLRKDKQLCEQRIQELDILIKKIFEQSVLGTLSKERLATLAAGYESEQAEIKNKLSAISKEIEITDSKQLNADRFIAIVDKYTNIDSLTPEIMSEFIDKVLVHKPIYDGNNKRHQTIEIYFNGIGAFDYDSCNS